MRVEDLERGFQREAASNVLNMGSLQREAVTSAMGDGSEHLRALGIDSRATHYGRHQLPSPHVCLMLYHRLNSMILGILH